MASYSPGPIPLMTSDLPVHILLYIVLTCIGGGVVDGSEIHILTSSDLIVASVGTGVQLNCEFDMRNFNLFDNPVLWRKIQHQEEMQINMMGNLQEPFASTKRLKVSYIPHPPSYRLQLDITDVAVEDSGVYVCEIHGPQNTRLGNVTHQLSVEAQVDAIVLTNLNASQNDLIRTYRRPKSLTYIERIPSLFRCIVICQSSPKQIRIVLGRRDVTSDFEFNQSIAMRGVPGLRSMTYTLEAWSRWFRPTAEDDGKKVKCAVHSRDVALNTSYVRLLIHFAPTIRCENRSSQLGETSVFIRCDVKCRPQLSALYWVIDNYTMLSNDDAVDNFWNKNQLHSDGTTETRLFIGHVTQDSFHSYVLIAENKVGLKRMEVHLVQAIRPTISAMLSKAVSKSRTTNARNYLLYRPSSFAVRQPGGIFRGLTSILILTASFVLDSIRVAVYY